MAKPSATPALRQYLAAVYRLSLAGAVRQTDVAQALGVSKPSVSRAVALLRRLRLLEERGPALSLTPEGLRLGRALAGMCRLLEEGAAGLGLPPEQAAAWAEQAACLLREDQLARLGRGAP